MGVIMPEEVCQGSNYSSGQCDLTSRLSAAARMYCKPSLLSRACIRRTV